MSHDKNWRVATDAFDVLREQQKQIEFERRRPNIRRPSDLGLGPGVGAQAVRLTDFNDVLATFNGFYAAAPGAANAPNSTHSFVGLSAVDEFMGGMQVFTALETGVEYRRRFQRYPGDESVILWGNWQAPSSSVPAVATDSASWATTIGQAQTLPLLAPQIDTFGPADTYASSYSSSSSSSGTTISLLKPGVYTGSVLITGISSTVVTASLTVPYKGGTRVRDVSSASLAGGVRLPFTAIYTTGQNTISIRVSHNTGGNQNITWREFQITRIGEVA